MLLLRYFPAFFFFSFFWCDVLLLNVLPSRPQTLEVIDTLVPAFLFIPTTPI